MMDGNSPWNEPRRFQPRILHSVPNFHLWGIYVECSIDLFGYTVPISDHDEHLGPFLEE